MPLNIEELKAKVFDLAIRGKLVDSSLFEGETVNELLERIRGEKDKLFKEGKLKKSKPISSITEDEIPFELNKNWRWVRLGEIGITQTGTTPSTKIKDYYNGEIAFIKPADISNDNGIDYNNESLTKRGLEVGRIIPKNSNMMVCIGGSIGKTYYTNKLVSCNQQINTLTPMCGVDVKFTHYLLSSEYFYNEILKSASGTATPIINKSMWDSILVPVPPIDEQKQIVKRVESVLKALSKLEREVESQLATLDQLRKKTLDLTIKGKLVPQDENDTPASELLKEIKIEREKLIKEKKIKKSKKLNSLSEDEIPFEIPESWEWVRLGSIGKVIGGGTPKSQVVEYWKDGTIPWITPADLSGYEEKYISYGKRNITEIGLHESSARLLPKGSVLFSSRAPIGHIAIAENEISTNQGFKSIVPHKMDMNNYIYYFLKWATPRINNSASGTTFKEVSGTIVSNILIPIPPLTEQKRIVHKVETLINLINVMENELKRKIEYVDKLVTA